MTQRPPPQELHQQAVPVLRDLVKVQTKYCDDLSIHSLIYALVRHLAVTIAVHCDNDEEYHEWVNVLMNQFRQELKRERNTSAVA
jgi:hypothetical protein